MAYLNANIPVTYAQIRREYLYDLKKHHGEVEDCIIFGLTSITGRPILFHAIMENGAIFYRLPISAFIQRGFNPKKVPGRRLDELELWNCFSYYPAVTSYDILDGQSGKYIGKDKKWYYGAYLFTVDFAHPESNIVDTDHSEIPHEHKCAHILALDAGNYAAPPNNRLIWTFHHSQLRTKFLTGKYRQVSGMLKTLVNGERKTLTTSFTKLRRKKMFRRRIRKWVIKPIRRWWRKLFSNEQV